MALADRSSDLSQIAVNANNIPDDSIDCGIRQLGWCRGASCQKFARLRTFVTVLAVAGILQGACETYFRISAKEAALENDYNPLIVEWLLVTSGIFQAIIALTFAHWAHKRHAISWLAGAIMLQSAVCVIAVIPAITNFADGVVPSTKPLDDNLCSATLYATQKALLTPQQSKWATLIMLFVLQLALGMASVAFYTVGIIYIDDNSPSIDSPAVIATTLGARIFGLQFGSALILGVGALSFGWWLGWVVLGVLVFVSGLLLGLFPKRLPKTVIHQAAQRIIEETRTHQFGSQFSTYIDDTDFGPSVKRLFSNKLLMFNLMSIMFVQAAAVNYLLQEENYMQSRFFLPFNEQDGLLQEWRARFISYFLRPPVAAIGMLIGGLVISKLKFTGRKIAGINIAMGVHLMAIFIAYVFIKCDVGAIAGTATGKLHQPYCSKQCICAPTSFLPVCPENSTTTFFSPCYAGCTRRTAINSIELYEGCTCASDFDRNSWKNIRATAGACSADSCANMLIVFQVLSLSAAGILGVMAIGKIIINLRCVLPQDKALALAMELMFVGLFAYIPAHLAYDVATRATCIYWAPEYAKCLLRETPLHGNILNILSASLILIGIFFDILVYIFAKGLNLYNCKVTDVNYTPSLYAAVPQVDQSPTATVLTAAEGGSPVTTTTTTSPQQSRQLAQPTRPAPKPDINVYRNPSSVTSSSAGENSIEPNGSVQYAQVVFPPDKHKANDGSDSPKRMAVRADVPLHHLSSQDVRLQLQSLKSFHPEQKTTETQLNTPPIGSVTEARLSITDTQLDVAVRAQSPETDF